MKKHIVLVLALLLNSLMFAQGGGFNYKALITNGGSALSNHAVNIKFTVLENSTTNVYQETHSATTDANGIVSAIVGEGNTVSGDFTTIDWGNNPYFLKVEIDSGSGYQDFGTNELKAVPYAKFAEKAGNTFSGSFNDLTNIPSGLADGDDVNDADHSTTNEIQHISKSGSTVTLSNGGGTFTDAVNDADHLTSNELQYLSVNGTQLSITNGNTVSLPDPTDADFYKENTTMLATNINDDIYTMGNVAIGKNTADYPLDIVSNTSNKGVNVQLTTGGSADQQGAYNELSGSGSGVHFGNYNKLLGTGIGDQYGVKNNITNSGNGKHYGSYSNVYGSGTARHYGAYNKLSGSGTGAQYGVYNNIDNSGNNEHYGSYSKLGGNGNGRHYGSYNELSGSGTGKQYGVLNVVTNTGNATLSGSSFSLSGSGSGDKYGTYNLIATSAGGTHYAVYGKAKKSGSYAGYFKGDVQMTQKLKANDSGDADMKAYIYGEIGYDGSYTNAYGAHTDGFTVSKLATGYYRVTFTNPPGSAAAYTVMVAKRYIGFITVKNYASYFEIRTYDTSGIPESVSSRFLVFKK